jgi:hypothetical protein
MCSLEKNTESIKAWLLSNENYFKCQPVLMMREFWQEWQIFSKYHWQDCWFRWYTGNWALLRTIKIVSFAEYPQFVLQKLQKGNTPQMHTHFTYENGLVFHQSCKEHLKTVFKLRTELTFLRWCSVHLSHRSLKMQHCRSDHYKNIKVHIAPRSYFIIKKEGNRFVKA